MVATAQARNKKTGNKPIGRVNMVAGFVVDRIDEKTMRSFLEANPEIAKAVGDTDGYAVEQIGVALFTHFEKTTAAKDAIVCDYCLGVSSPEAGDRCPYCGTDDAELQADAASESVAQSVPKGQDVPTDEPSEKPAKKTKAAKKSSTTVAAADKETTKEEKDTEAHMDTTHANGASTTKGLAKTKGTSGKLTVAELDKAVSEVERLKSAAAGSYWQLGRKILEVYTATLWKLRLTDDGKQRYKGFEAFCHHEFKMSHTHAYKLMDVAKKFSEEDVSRFGTTKLGLLLQAPPENQGEIEKKIRSGASTKQVKEAVGKSRKEKGFKKPGGKGRKQETKATGRAPEKITIASIEGRKTVKLYAKPASMRNVDFNELKRAKKIGDIPFGRLELANDVVMYISIQDHNGELVAVVDTRRETAAAAE
jgi:hypothetical protein